MKISPEKYDSGVDALQVCLEAKDCKRNATNVQKTNQSKKAAKYRSAFMAGYKSWKCLQSISAMWKIYPKLIVVLVLIKNIKEGEKETEEEG